MYRMKKQVLLIKLGGSIITNKTIEQSVQYDVLRSLVMQIKAIRAACPELSLVIGHGQGSFAHFPAKKYRLNEGMVVEDAQYGLAVTLDVVAKLNRIVVTELLGEHLPAVSLFPSQIALAKSGQPHSAYLATLEEYLKLGLLPVVTGDAIVDLETGCTIWSADFSLPYYARQLQGRGWKIHSVIHVTKTPGVYRDVDKPELGIFETITTHSFDKIFHQLGSAHR